MLIEQFTNPLLLWPLRIVKVPLEAAGDPNVLGEPALENLLHLRKVWGSAGQAKVFLERLSDFGGEAHGEIVPERS